MNPVPVYALLVEQALEELTTKRNRLDHLRQSIYEHSERRLNQPIISRVSTGRRKRH